MLMFSSLSMAGACKPSGGNAKRFDVAFIKTFTDTSDNSAGALFANTHNWDLGGSYPGSCTCWTSQSKRNIHYTTIINSDLLEGAVKSVNGRNVQFYRINKNLEVGSEIYIQGALRNYFPIPFSNLDNKSEETGCSGTSMSVSFTSGSKGKVHLLINRPFVGTSVIPATKLFDLYASMTIPSPPSLPIAAVYLSAEVTVPQNCKLAPGQQTTIDFGELLPPQLASPGSGGLNAVNRSFQIQCANISAGVKINLALEGRPHELDARYLETTHQDVAVAMESGGKLVEPNVPGAIAGPQQLVPIALDYPSQKAQFDLSAWPVKMRARPQPGAFQGSATLKFDFE